MTVAPMPYTHLAVLSDDTGVFEHALFDRPRPEHGYCVDDVARALLVAVREPEQTPALAALTETALRFLESSLDAGGRAHNRRSVDGEWLDAAGVGDWWGRAVWALGSASARAALPFTRRRALHAFHRAAATNSPHLRAMAFAGLGAAEAARADPADVTAYELLARAVHAVPPAGGTRDWPWPEARLTYANAAIAELLIAAGPLLGDEDVTARGLALLGFLLRIETVDGHLSVSGSGGRGPGDRGARFDQQPIEVAAMADACARAYELTGDSHWRDGVRLCWAWFTGENDSGTVMIDAATGAGFDGLERDGRNENRGAESTLAALSTSQQARRLHHVRAAP